MLFDNLVRDNRKILGSFSFLPRTGRCEINGRLFNKKREAREREAGFTAQITTGRVGEKSVTGIR